MSYRRGAMRFGTFGLIVLALAACRPPVDRAPSGSGKVRVRVFTEPSPVRWLASAGKFVFVATDGDLERWDAEGKVLPVSAHGQIVALSPDVDRTTGAGGDGRRWVWILTDRGLERMSSGVPREIDEVEALMKRRSTKVVP